ncbi:unnamed protein product [Chondrus crispus]|uniref:Uncharacterized protein n=1 Tax=Chondrus crispus TaxID=2769 RepID=R7QIT2_CHOCR|nr:unnamed protein product [Chondrus crispus]CDF37663.1 unnamed protein product [Chondrus crispus]|eukprot:XP_005717534.1 unnamed protein product [Chondrus crispus]
MRISCPRMFCQQWLLVLSRPSETKQHQIKMSPVRTCPADVASDLPNTVTVQRWRFALIHPRQHCSGGIDA